MTAKHAAVTIVSKNYFAAARTLAQSYLEHHPDHDFMIVLVDKADGYLTSSLPCGAEVIEIANIGIPDLTRLIYRYTIMELNTAVKPFVLADLFEKRGYETLLYIDPDIWIFQPLEEVYAALERGSVALTPHIRRPYYDDHLPSDTTILQSGTYNLGFIGLRRGSTATRLLDWWMTKLYRDCVVDIPNGLFVDQKWIDMIPGFFPDHRIIHHPGYNVAYWNLHERRLNRDGDTWRVDDDPLVFFHFSGYVPYAPDTLSKHQNRHDLKGLPLLKSLTDAYGAELMRNGYRESNAWPYAFETLPNGVRIPLQLVRDVMQWAARYSIPTPCPIEEPDAFCRFLMSRDALPNQPKSVLLFHFLLRARGDVVAAYPNSLSDSDDPGFRAWISSGGIREYKLKDLLKYEAPAGSSLDLVADTFQKLRKSARPEVLSTFRSMWTDRAVFLDFLSWLGTHGQRQLKCTKGHAESVARAVPGVGRILNIYFRRQDLQHHYPALHEHGQLAAFIHWIRGHRYELELHNEDISLFSEFAMACGPLLDKMRFLYQVEDGHAVPSIYTVEARLKAAGNYLLSADEMRDFLAEETAIAPLDQFLSRFEAATAPVTDFGKCSVPGLEARKNFDFIARVQSGLAERAAQSCRINFCGYLNAASGMGESARSMRASLSEVGADVRAMALPHPQAVYDELPSQPELFGWPISGADLSITVANADAAQTAKDFLPRSYWARRNVGYWVWETEQLPVRFAESGKLFDEIWTPSRYSAEAIARTVDTPVHVLRHTLDFAAIDRAQSDRRRFEMPESATVFGFAFDPKSVLERKNVAGLVKAFKMAFRDDDGCYLVLKANGTTQGAYDYQMIQSKADWDHVLFMETTLARDDTFDFMKSLDVYVSLHRSEGFGLTCAEAMALGVPVIASGYSGNLEFMDGGNSLLVPVTVIETDRPYGPYPAGTRWGDADLEAAAQAMRALLDPEMRSDLGSKGAAAVRNVLGTQAVGARAVALIGNAADGAAGRQSALLSHEPH